jgi:hypothetical protein
MRDQETCAPSALIGRTFRVHFRAEADVAGGVWAGRVEHLQSGDAAHFASIDELRCFVALWLGRADRRRGARQLSGEGRSST